MERNSNSGRKYTIPMFRTGVLLDRSITNVAIVFQMSDKGDEKQMGEQVTVAASRVLAARSKLEKSNQATMDDTFVQPCRLA